MLKVVHVYNVAIVVGHVTEEDFVAKNEPQCADAMISEDGNRHSLDASIWQTFELKGEVVAELAKNRNIADTLGRYRKLEKLEQTYRKTFEFKSKRVLTLSTLEKRAAKANSERDKYFKYSWDAGVRLYLVQVIDHINDVIDNSNERDIERLVEEFPKYSKVYAKCATVECWENILADMKEKIENAVVSLEKARQTEFLRLLTDDWEDMPEFVREEMIKQLSGPEALIKFSPRGVLGHIC